jgi:subtilase family serine protease/ribosomal protein L40E
MPYIIVSTTQELTVGTHKFEVQIDPENQVGEHNETNNIWNVTIEIAEKPDLTFSDMLIFSDTTFVEGTPCTITTHVKNIGGFNATNIEIVYFIDLNNNLILDAGEQISSTQLIPLLQQDEIAQLELTWLLPTAGEYTVICIIDPNNTIDELYDGNNVLTGILTVKGRPDLTLSPGDIVFEPLDDIPEGYMVNISITVRNLGGSNATAIMYQVYDGDPAAGGTLITTGEISYLVEDTAVTCWLHWTAEPVGEHNIYVIVDPENSIEEANETNNIAYRTLTVIEKLDLLLPAFDIYPDVFVSNGTTIKLNATCKHVGEYPAYNILIEFYVGDPVLEPEVATLIDRVVVASIMPNTQIYLEATWLPPEVGEYQIYVIVDRHDDIPEANENNNKVSKLLTVVSRADLAIYPTDIIFYYVEDYLVPGVNVTIEATIHNLGSWPANNIIVQFYEGSPDLGGSKLGQDIIIPTIDAQNTTTVNTSWLPATPALYEIFVIVDPEDTVDESTNLNNMASIEIQVLRFADIVIEAVWVTNETPIEGSVIELNAKLRNDGDVPAYNVTVEFYNGDPELGGMQIGDPIVILAIAPSTEVTVSIYWLPPAAGDYTIFVVADPLNVINEITKLNNRAYAEVIIFTRADLQVINIEVSCLTPIENDIVTINATVENSGDATATNITVKLFINEPKPALQIATDQLIAKLECQELANISVNWTASAPGKYLIYVWVDAYNTTWESDELNNIMVYSELIWVFKRTYPDIALNASSFQLPKGNLIEGMNVTINVNVYNIGDANATKIRVEFYTSADMTKVQTQTLTELLIGTNATVQFYWVIPKLVVTNKFTLYSQVKLLTGVDADLTNNNYSIDVTVYTLPDLIIADTIKFYVNGELLEEDDAKIILGQELEVQATIRCIGNNYTKPLENVIVRFYLGKPSEGKQIGEDILLSFSSENWGLDEIVSVYWTPTELGKHTIYIVVDVGNNVRETAENNNQRSKSIKVKEEVLPQPKKKPEGINPLYIMLAIIVPIVAIISALILIRKRKRAIEMAECSVCGASIELTATTCPKCGAEFAEEVRCPECGIIVPEDATDCPECGTTIVKEEEEEVPAEKEEVVEEEKEKLREEEEVEEEKEVEVEKVVEEEERKPEEVEEEKVEVPERKKLRAKVIKVRKAVKKIEEEVKEEPEKAECPECGELIPVTADTCPKCGKIF